MKVYHNKNLRHVVRVYGKRIITSLQYRKGWFWQIAKGYGDIEFEVRPDSPKPKANERQFISSNPSIMQFNLGGHLETWDESTFNLRDRLSQLAAEYTQEQNRLDRQMQLMNNQIEKL